VSIHILTFKYISIFAGEKSVTTSHSCPYSIST